MKRNLFLVLLTLLSCQLFAQTKIEGNVRDAADQKPLEKATAMLVQAKDSVLLNFTRSDKNGKFLLETDYKEEVIIFVSYPKFAAYTQKFSPNVNQSNLEIDLTSIGQILEEVVITGRLPITIKGDTVEYSASNFQTDANAKAEDLFKELPGITVDENGQITAQGKQVQKVLVDGEEFFGNDPVLVSRTLRADMIDKVQVYESKSDMADRTGVDDGVRQQTINVTLKDNAKKGAFGSITAGGGQGSNSPNYYSGKAMLNRFNDTQKIGAFFLASNTGEIGLNFIEENKYGIGGGATTLVMEDGGIFITSIGDQFSYWDGRGNPKSISTGISFNDIINKNKQKINGNYSFGKIENLKIENTLTQNTLPNGELNSVNDSRNHSESLRNRVSLNYENNIDSLTSLRMSVYFNKTNSSGMTSNEEFTRNGNFDLINQNSREQLNDSKQEDGNMNINITRKLQKPGRSLSAVLTGSINSRNNDAFLKSNTQIFNNLGDSTILIDQFKDESSKATSLRGQVTYTEPITKDLNSSFSYSWANNENISKSYAYNSDGQNYTHFDEEFSNDFNYLSTKNSLNANLNYKIQKVTIVQNNEFSNDKIYQKNNFNNMDNERNFFNYNPSVRVSYAISRHQSFSFNVAKRTTLPSLTQIQPLKNNTNPLQLVMGNEALKPSNSLNYSLNYTRSNPAKNSFFYIFSSMNQNFNSIQLNRIIDPETGITTSVYENISNKNGLSLNASAMSDFQLIKNWNLFAGAGLGYYYQNNYNFINGELNNFQSNSFNPSFGLGTRNIKNLTSRANFNITFQNMKNSLQPQLNNDAVNYNGSMYLAYTLPLDIQIISTLDYTVQEPTEVFQEKFEKLTWHPEINKSFLKDKSLKLSFKVNDAFNQNKGFVRRNSGNLITQNTYNTISRYYMLRMTWDFTTIKGN